MATKTNTARKITRTKTITTTSLLDEFQLLIDDIIISTFNRQNLNESLTSNNENLNGAYRPRLFHMIDSVSKSNGFKTLNDIDITYRQICELDHLQLDNPENPNRLKWTNRWIKKADRESRQKVPQAVTQMFTDFRSCFKSIDEGGLTKKVKYLPIEFTSKGIEKPRQNDPTQKFDIFGKYDSYQDLLKDLNESRENAKDENAVELKTTSKYVFSYLWKNPQVIKSFYLGFLDLCIKLEIPTSAPTQKKTKTKITARPKKSKQK
jgi:hypothetical protein